MGFEPTDAFTSPVFKTGAFDHSAISPCVKVRSTQTQELFYHRGIVLSIKNKRRKDGFFRKNMLTFAARSGIINKLIRFRRCKKQNIRVWRSLVSRLNGVQEASSSNLDTRTMKSERTYVLSDFIFSREKFKQLSAANLDTRTMGEIRPAKYGQFPRFSFFLLTFNLR